MKIKLYKLTIYTSERKLEPLDFEIEGRLISYSEPPNDPDSEFPHDGFMNDILPLFTVLLSGLFGLLVAIVTWPPNASLTGRPVGRAS